MKHAELSSVPVVIALAGAVTLSAQSIPLVNAGFEIPTVPVGSNNGGTILGWQIAYGNVPPHCPDGTVPFIGVAHPPASQLTPPSDGSPLGYSHQGNSQSFTQGMIFQTLPVVYARNTTQSSPGTLVTAGGGDQ